ncbi:nucleotidyltransferase [Bremerella sp. JC770]|uniref:nucleotidyltransferase domain-containing protein n=1 Tax=Bremerella sp. JC770 TaxID=3232137 RepID=UPI003459F5BD
MATFERRIAMHRIVQASTNPEFDEILERLCELLQPTISEWNDAEQKYKAVGNWLSVPNTRLAPFYPDIKYQGSALLGTVVRPWEREEFDVDLLCLLSGINLAATPPIDVFEMVAQRMEENATYRELMVRKERCIAINYAGQFHLDIVPAVFADSSSSRLYIPDRSSKIWIRTDPFGYAQWFAKRTRLTEVSEGRIVRADVAPLPPARRASEITTLQRMIQLAKRRRDIYFDGRDDAPKSIALTTLLANCYRGEELCTDGLIGALGRILQEIRQTPGILYVPNPVDPSENLGRHWNEQSFRRFVRFVEQFHEEMIELLSTNGIDTINALLTEMFGGKASQALTKYAEAMQASRRAGTIGFASATASLTTAQTNEVPRIPRNEFFGN